MAKSAVQPIKAGSMYSLEIIAERQEIFSQLTEARDNPGRPIVSGFTSDSEGTTSREQGISIHPDGKDLIFGYHVIDAGAIPAGGAIDLQGYKQQTSSEGSMRQMRMLADQVLYARLNLAKKSTDRSPVPVVSFYLAPTNDQLECVRVEHSLFVSEAEVTPTTDRYDEAISLEGLKKALQSTGAPSEHFELYPASESHLERSANKHASALLRDLGIYPLCDERGQASMHRPLRNWSDLKNLQMVSHLIEHETPLYTREQLSHMRERAAGRTKEFDHADILPDPTANLLKRILLTKDLTKRQLTSTEFGELVDHFDPDVRGNDPLLINILNWAEQRELVKIERDSTRVTALRFTFHNLENPLVLVFLNINSETSMHTIAYEAIVRYLQACPKPSAQLSNRAAREQMRIIKAQANGAKHYGKDIARALQSLGSRGSLVKVRDGPKA